ncbi:MAG: KpsF/GutQ family sugar-phosphate isomerase [Proteobacteria bacterium]|nr:KpsF/GutQ family sugar-phosphate isomerase [Pseudomonadota bacterium]
MNQTAIKQLAAAVIETELDAVKGLLSRIDDDFVRACEIMLTCKGRVIVIGMGKSGHIGNKIAATLASTGTPAFFVHPAEASHGDLGMITTEDVLLIISSSGETNEVNQILPQLLRLGTKSIAMTGNPESTLARHADVHINVSVDKEACPLGLAPTSSTTAALVMGDALAISLLESRGFTREDFAQSHPAGQLGRRLLLHVDEIMHKGDDIPHVGKSAMLTEGILEMTEKRLGMVAIVDDDEQLLGVYTDGDLRRTLEFGQNPTTTAIVELMHENPITITPGDLAVNAVNKMQKHRIQGLLVVADNNKLVGALNFQDLLQAGVV